MLLCLREYNWGVCEIENSENSDFLKLYDILSSKTFYY